MIALVNMDPALIRRDREAALLMTFAELGLSPKVLEAVTSSGYTVPTPIQAQAIPQVLARKDVLGIAQTGTGKTAAFTLPMLTLLEQGRARARMPRTLILEPTRELAAQVEENFTKYGANQKLSVALLIGGVVVTESVYAIPGLGRLTVDAVLARDFPTIQGVILLFSFVYVLVNLLVDLSYVFFDPRIRY